MAQSRPTTPAVRVPFDVAATDLIVRYRQAHELAVGYMLAAAERGAEGTEAYWQKQLAAVDAAMARLKREAGGLIPATVREPYRATALAVDATTGAHTRVGAFRFTGVHQDAVAALEAAARQELDDAVRTVGRESRDIFRQVQLEQAALGKATGEARAQTSSRMATDLRNRGITAFVDRSGARWTLESYGKMTVRTNSREAATRAMLNRQTQAGLDLLQISSHNTLTHLCRIYEGHTYSISGNHARFPLPPETGYRGNRWPPYHPNCWHLATPASSTLDEYEAALDRALAAPDDVDPDDLLAGPGEDGGPSPGRVNDVAGHITDHMAEFMQARPGGDPAAGDPFVKDGKVYVALEPLREHLAGKTGETITRGELKAAVEHLGFTRRPYTYRTADGRQTSASYYSAPAENVLRRGTPPPPAKPVVVPPPPPKVEIPAPVAAKPSPDAVPLASPHLDEARKLIAQMQANTRLRKDPDHLELIGQRIREEVDRRSGAGERTRRSLDISRRLSDLDDEWRAVNAEARRHSPVISERPPELLARLRAIEDETAKLTEERWRLRNPLDVAQVAQLRESLARRERNLARAEHNARNARDESDRKDFEREADRLRGLIAEAHAQLALAPRDEREVLREVLGELRPGFGTGKIKVQDPAAALGFSPAELRAARAAGVNIPARDVEAERELQRVAIFYPKEWVNNSNRAGSIQTVLNRGGRGFYRHMLGDEGLVNLGNGGDTTVHEFGHRIQYTTRASGRKLAGGARGAAIGSRIDAVLGVLHKRRTKGERAQPLGKPGSGYRNDEVAKRDQYITAYVGKEYGGDPRELFTMGLEGVWGTRFNTKVADSEMWNVVVGMLAAL